MFVLQTTHFDLANIDLPVLLAQFFVRLRHGIQGYHGIPQVLRRESGTLDIKGLLGKLCQLRLVHALLLECTHGALLDRFLYWSQVTTHT